MMGLNMESRTFSLTLNGKTVEPPRHEPGVINISEEFKRCDIVRTKKGKLLTHTTPKNTVRASLSNSFIGLAA